MRVYRRLRAKKKEDRVRRRQRQSLRTTKNVLAACEHLLFVFATISLNRQRYAVPPTPAATAATEAGNRRIHTGRDGGGGS